MSFLTLLKISRPRFWHYVLWPMLIYFAGSWYLTDMHASFLRWGTDWIVRLIIMIIILWYFTLPANLWIYGRNDIADGDTDKFNSKKWSYENKIDDSKTMKNKLRWNIWWWNVWYILLWTLIVWWIWQYQRNIVTAEIWPMPWWPFPFLVLLIFSIICLFVFLLTSYLYSCRPLRAKAKPFIDGIMNILYIATPFSIILLENQRIFRPISTTIITYNFFAALCRCMAMHCYSAIPDIEPDHQAWLTTTAVYLGKQNALIYCAILYLLSALLSFSTLWWFSILGWVIYGSVMIVSYYRKDIFALYKLFPYINLIIWFLLFWYIICLLGQCYACVLSIQLFVSIVINRLLKIWEFGINPVIFVFKICFHLVHSVALITIYCSHK